MKIIIKELEPESSPVVLVRVGDFFLHEKEQYLRLPNDPIDGVFFSEVPKVMVKAFALSKRAVVIFTPNTQVVTTYAELTLTKHAAYYD